jgi:hypothetical protein
MNTNKDLIALKRIAEQRDYGALSAIMDLSGVGALYHMGADQAQIDRLSKISDIKDPVFNGYVQEYSTSAKRSLAARAGYLTSGAVTAAGACVESGWVLSLGAIGMAIFAALFMLRAGFNESDRETFQAIQVLKEPSK